MIIFSFINILNPIQSSKGLDPNQCFKCGFPQEWFFFFF